ncbi:hypothetical protein [Nocardiopsis salina]|nr:hypothetical protein [Nocardiopsis salina]
MDPSTRLAHAVRALTGTDAPLTGVHTLTGGHQKAVRRLHLDHRAH